MSDASKPDTSDSFIHENPRHKDLPQIIRDGQIKRTRNGEGEIISFDIPLGPVKLICIVNIPEEGKTVAPVYVKFDIDLSIAPIMRRKRFTTENVG